MHWSCYIYTLVGDILCLIKPQRNESLIMKFLASVKLNGDTWPNWRCFTDAVEIITFRRWPRPPLLSSPPLSSAPLSPSLPSPVFFLPKWPSESLMIQRDSVSIGRCVSCLVTLKINHLATLSQSVTFLCFPGTDCSKSTGPLGEMRAGKGGRWSGQSPSKLAIRLHI